MPERRDRYSDDQSTGGRENGVFVVHEDGTMAADIHMSERGVFADVGDEAEAGDVLGLVGTSGTARNDPHLHVEIFEGRGDGLQWCKTLPVDCRNAKGPSTSTVASPRAMTKPPTARSERRGADDQSVRTTTTSWPWGSKSKRSGTLPST